MRILCIGESLLETTAKINTSLIEGSNIKLQDKTECGGGRAGNIAYLLGKWGVETYIASMMGSDDAASKIKKEYESIGVKTEFIETSFDKGTTTEVVIVNETNKLSTKIKLASNAYLKKYAFGIEPDIIVADGNDFNATVSAFDKFSKVQNYLVINKIDNEILELCRYASNIIFNLTSAEIITNIKIDFNNSSTLVNVYNKIKQKYSKSEIIITLGEKGCIYSINGQVKIMPPVKLDIVDTNGAGDVFAGAYIYSMGRNFGLEKSIAYATIASSLSVGKLTSRLSIPSLTEVSSYYDSKFGAQNNPNTQSREEVNTNISNMNPTEQNTNVVNNQNIENKEPNLNSANTPNSGNNVN